MTKRRLYLLQPTEETHDGIQSTIVRIKTVGNDKERSVCTVELYESKMLMVYIKICI